MSARNFDILIPLRVRDRGSRALEGAVGNEDPLFWKHAKDWERSGRAKHAK